MTLSPPAAPRTRADWRPFLLAEIREDARVLKRLLIIWFLICIAGSAGHGPSRPEARSWFGQPVRERQVAQAKATLRYLASHLRRAELEHPGSAPSDSVALATAAFMPYSDDKWLLCMLCSNARLDPWGSPYRIDGVRGVVSSLGPPPTPGDHATPPSLDELTVRYRPDFRAVSAQLVPTRDSLLLEFSAPVDIASLRTDCLQLVFCQHHAAGKVISCFVTEDPRVVSVALAGPLTSDEPCALRIGSSVRSCSGLTLPPELAVPLSSTAGAHRCSATTHTQ